MLSLFLILLLQATQSVELKRFEVVRVNSEDVGRLPASLRAIFADPVPNADAIGSLEEAVNRVGLTPRLPKSDGKPDFGVIAPYEGAAKISVAELNAALGEAKATDISAPQDWDGVSITIKQGGGILADYGSFVIMQAPPLTFTTPSTFPLDRLMEVILRIVGVDAADARAIRGKFAKSPASFFPISLRYSMDIHEVQLNSGSGLILQNADKVGERAFSWSSADRSYFLIGQLSEAEALQLANSVQ